MYMIKSNVARMIPSTFNKELYKMNENKGTEIKRSAKAENILSQINSKTKLGELRKIAKEIKKDHELAMELWSTEQFLPRLLAILIMDKKFLSQDVLDKL